MEVAGTDSVDFIVKLKPWRWVFCWVVTYLIIRETLPRLEMSIAKGLNLRNRRKHSMCGAACGKFHDMLLMSVAKS